MGVVVHLCARDIDFASIWFSMGIWRCSDSVVFSVFHLILFINIYWHPTRFPYHMLLVSLNNIACFSSIYPPFLITYLVTFKLFLQCLYLQKPLFVYCCFFLILLFTKIKDMKQKPNLKFEYSLQLYFQNLHRFSLYTRMSINKKINNSVSKIPIIFVNEINLFVF